LPANRYEIPIGRCVRPESWALRMLCRFSTAGRGEWL
jgi:hypothetical protein